MKNNPWVKGLIAISALVSVAACENSITRQSAPGLTGGDITVGSPQVFTRERLLNDRYDQAAWLKRQLDATDSKSFNFQGGIDFSQFSGRATKLSVVTDVTKGSITRPSVTTSGTGDTANTTLVDTAGTPSGAESNKQRLADASKLKTADAIAASPTDDFRDHLAHREEIRGELISTQLDDRHDIAGNTLVQLKFDVTVIPEKDTGSWAIVNMRAKENVDRRPSMPNAQFLRLLESYLNDHLAALTRQALSWTLAEREKREILGFGETIRAVYFNKAKSKTANECAPGGGVDPENPLVSLVCDILAHDANFAKTWKSGTKVCCGEGESPLQNEHVRIALYRLITTYFFDRRIRLSHAYKYIDIKSGANNCSADKGCAVIVDKFRTSLGITDLKALLKQFNSDRSEIWAYAVTPKEAAQRISDAAARRKLTQDMFQLSALLGAVDVGAAAAFINESQLLLQAIRRQPLVVGFTDRAATVDTGSSGANDNSQFGWAIGPKFRIDQNETSAIKGKRVQFSFRHTIQQNALMATLSVPSWWSALDLEVGTCWLKSADGEHNTCVQGGPWETETIKFKKADGTEESKTQYKQPVKKFAVDLPFDIQAFLSVLLGNIEPTPSPNILTPILYADAPGQVLIEGSNMWRNTKVTLGSQVASNVTIMPDMRGIIAHFDFVRPPPGWNPATGSDANVVIWTSDGHSPPSTVRIIKQPDATELALAVDQPRFVEGGDIEARALSGRLPATTGTHALSVQRDIYPRTAAEDGTNLLISDAGRRVSAKFSGKCTACNSGEAVIVTYAYTPQANASPRSFEATGRPLYYKTAEVNATAGLAGGASPSTMDATKNYPFEITFPKFAQRGWPGFVPDNAAIVALVNGNVAPIEIASTGACTVKDGKPLCGYVMKPSVAFKTLVDGAVQSVTLKVQAAGFEAPGISGTFTFPKPN